MLVFLVITDKYIFTSKHCAFLTSVGFIVYFYSACDDNYWGTNCASICSCPYGTTCDKVIGCLSCPDGYKGADCNEDVDECAENANMYVEL